MSYFGGLGAGKGWNKFKFVLTPAELKEVFEGLDYWFVITNCRVDINYSVNDKISLFDSYKVYFNKITSGQAWDKREDHQIESGVRLSITDDPKKIKFEERRDRKGELSREFKLVRHQEPVINISPFYLLYEQNKLTIETMNEEGILGLELSFPKFFSLDSERHEQLHETSNFSTRKLFAELASRIAARTRKSKLISPTKLFKPNFRISADSIEMSNRNYYLRKNDLSLN